MEWPTFETFARRPRAALMWLPRGDDISRIAAILRAAGPRVVDVGAGTGLLAVLISKHGVEVELVDSDPPKETFMPVAPRKAEELESGRDAAIVSWMEAGMDYREAVARIAPVIVNIYDVEGGCGVMGATDFAPYGFTRAVAWRTPSFEDAEFFVDRPGRGMVRGGHPGNRIDILVRDASEAEKYRQAIADAPPGERLPWEDDMDRAGF